MSEVPCTTHTLTLSHSHTLTLAHSHSLSGRSTRRAVGRRRAGGGGIVLRVPYERGAPLECQGALISLYVKRERERARTGGRGGGVLQPVRRGAPASLSLATGSSLCVAPRIPRRGHLSGEGQGALSGLAHLGVPMAPLVVAGGGGLGWGGGEGEGVEGLVLIGAGGRGLGGGGARGGASG